MNLKESIIHESLRLFSLKGFLSTSIQDILSAADTSKGGFYNHFKSKEDLFYQVLEEARNIWRERCLYRMDQKKDAVEEDSRGRRRGPINVVSFLLVFLFVWLVFDNFALGLLFGLIFGGGSEMAQRAAGKQD